MLWQQTTEQLSTRFGERGFLFSLGGMVELLTDGRAASQSSDGDCSSRNMCTFKAGRRGRGQHKKYLSFISGRQALP